MLCRRKISFLSLATSITKLPIVTDRDSCPGFGRESDGRLPEDVKLWRISVPDQPGTL